MPKGQPAFHRQRGSRIESESGETKGRYPVHHVSYISVPAAGSADDGLKPRKHTVSFGIIHRTDTFHSDRKLNGTNMPLAVRSEDRDSFTARE